MAYIAFTPNYTSRSEAKRTRDIITNTEWNELWNLNSVQGDHSELYLYNLSRYLFPDTGFDGTVRDMMGTVNTHMSNTSNPHSVTKAQVGLGNCDNTSDADKPISTATQTAFDAVYVRIQNEHNSIWAETARIDAAKVEKSIVVTTVPADDTKIPTAGAVNRAIVGSGRLPSGGLNGQTLCKNSDDDYDLTWKDQVPIGGEQGQVLMKKSDSDLDLEWGTVASGGGDGGDLADLTICAGDAEIGTDWTQITFPREFMLAPIVTANILNADNFCSVLIKDVTTSGFKAKINQIVISDGAVTPTKTNGYISSSTTWTAVQTDVVQSVAYTKQELSVQAVSGTIHYMACLDKGTGK